MTLTRGQQESTASWCWASHYIPSKQSATQGKCPCLTLSPKSHSESPVGQAE